MRSQFLLKRKRSPVAAIVFRDEWRGKAVSVNGTSIEGQNHLGDLVIWKGGKKLHVGKASFRQQDAVFRQGMGINAKWFSRARLVAIRCRPGVQQGDAWQAGMVISCTKGGIINPRRFSIPMMHSLLL